jgi:hypothetical protein|eukprot:SAG25_NODE_75_length_16951_cov_86.523208_9_plen_42_part_00
MSMWTDIEFFSHPNRCGNFSFLSFARGNFDWDLVMWRVFLP